MTADPPERDVLRQLLPGMNVVSIPDQRKLPDDGAVWLWDSQPLQGDPVPVGQRVDPERLASIPVGDPLRLLRIDHKLWTSCLETNISLETKSNDVTSNASHDDRYADLLPGPQGEQHLTQTRDDRPRSHRRRKYAQVTGEGPLAKPWHVWRCLHSITTFPFVVMCSACNKDNLRDQRATSLELIGISLLSWALRGRWLICLGPAPRASFHA